MSARSAWRSPSAPYEEKQQREMAQAGCAADVRLARFHEAAARRQAELARLPVQRAPVPRDDAERYRYWLLNDAWGWQDSAALTRCAISDVGQRSVYFYYLPLFRPLRAVEDWDGDRA